MPQATLSRWLREAGGSVDPMPKPRTPLPTPDNSKRPQDWTPEERLALVMEAAALDDQAVGELLRRSGLRSTHLKEWRRAALEALGDGQKKYKGKRSPEARRIRSLEAELRRKEKALAEAAALLVLQKKMQDYWEGREDDTERKNGK